MLNILFDFWQTMLSLWGNFFSFVFDRVGRMISSVTHAVSWVVRPLTLLTDETAEGIFAWWPLFCIVLAVLLLLLVVMAICAVTAYHKRKQ